MTTVLRLNVYMTLPDDFSGSLSEALGHFLALREHHLELPAPESVSARCASEPFYFNQRYGCSAAVEEGIWRLEGRTWKNLLEKPDCAITQGDCWVK